MFFFEGTLEDFLSKEAPDVVVTTNLGFPYSTVVDSSYQKLCNVLGMDPNSPSSEIQELSDTMFAVSLPPSEQNILSLLSRLHLSLSDRPKLHRPQSVLVDCSCPIQSSYEGLKIHTRYSQLQFLMMVDDSLSSTDSKFFILLQFLLGRSEC